MEFPNAFLKNRVIVFSVSPNYMYQVPFACNTSDCVLDHDQGLNLGPDVSNRCEFLPLAAAARCKGYVPSFKYGRD